MPVHASFHDRIVESDRFRLTAAHLSHLIRSLVIVFSFRTPSNLSLRVRCQGLGEIMANVIRPLGSEVKLLYGSPRVPAAPILPLPG
jgi:hypothetical protein